MVTFSCKDCNCNSNSKTSLISEWKLGSNVILLSLDKISNRHVWLWCEMFGFFSSRSLKTREKYISFVQFVYLLRKVCLLFNFWMINSQLCHKNHNCEFYHPKLKSKQKIYKLNKTNIFFSRFEGTRGDKNQIFRTLNLFIK